MSVTSRRLDDAAAFQALVNGALDKARQQSGYEQDKDNADSASLRFYASEGKARYHYREHFYYKAGIGVQLRCTRPVLDKTSPVMDGRLRERLRPDRRLAGERAHGAERSGRS